MASAIAIDGLLPIIASEDGKSAANTLTLMAEFTIGQGYGDEFPNWSGNLASLTSGGSSIVTSSGLVPGSVQPNLGSGLAGYDPNGTFTLVHLQTFNIQAQYHLPEGWDTFVTAGYTQLYSNNVDNLASASINYDRAETLFVNVFHSFSKQVRVGAEVDQFRTTYSDTNLNKDYRVGFSTYFIF
jgi:hypothetical protein